MSYDWALKQIKNLNKSTSENEEFDPDYLHLRNPYYDKIIENIFYNEFLPKIENAFSDSLFNIHKESDYPNLKNKISTKLCKKFIFCVDCSEISRLNRAWHTCFTLELFKRSYIFRTELTIYLPGNYNVNKILQLLKNKHFRGLPPKLQMNDNNYSIQFRDEKGTHWGMESHDEASGKVTKNISQIQNILTFLNNKEKELNKDKNFMKLENLLVNYFENF